MNLTQLEYLVAAVDKGSYALASKALYVTPQAMSKAVNDMERELGVELLVRVGRCVKPTEAALAIVEHARMALLASQNIEMVAELFRGGRPSKPVEDPEMRRSVEAT